MENREDRIRELESELDIHREGKCVQDVCARGQRITAIRIKIWSWIRRHTRL